MTVATKSNPESAAPAVGRPARLTPPPATLRIHVRLPDGGDVRAGGCLPSEEQVRAFCGENRLPLTRREGCFEGSFELDNVMVDIEADSFACDGTCRSFDPVLERTAVLVSRGCTVELDLHYRPGTASVQITPRFVEPAPGYGPISRRAVPGVRFLLFEGPGGSGTPLERVTTAANPTASFTGLQPGDKTLVVDPPSRFDDRLIELGNSRYAKYPFQIEAGQALVLDSQFEFTPAAGAVTVQVVEDTDDRRRVGGVPVRLAPTGEESEPAAVATDPAGLATFRSVPAGTYRVALAVSPLQLGGVSWITSSTPVVTVTAQDSRPTVELRLVADRHLVQGTVFGPEGAPLAHALVEIRRAPDDEDPLDTALADGEGRYEWEAPHAGTFHLAVVAQDGDVRRVVPVQVNSVARQDLFVTGIGVSSGGAGGATGSGGSRGSGVDQDPTPFPLLVGAVDLTEGTAPGRSGDGSGHGYGPGSGSGPAAGAGATVAAAIRDVLGYRARTADVKGFVSALHRSFSCTEQRGYTVCAWTPRSYAATIPADLGALTGAQASIYERAKVTLDATLPLLNGLRPLLSDADHEDVEAIRTIVRSRLTEIVAELALEGGPRTQRVDELFERLTGALPSADPRNVVLVDVNTIRGELGVVGVRFGMLRQEVNTIAEEENFTNFLIIVDSVATLFTSWQQIRGFFLRSIDGVAGEADSPFLGTQLVLISRQLGVISETVRETYFAMDSVFLGPAERQTVLLALIDEGGVATTMLLSELLDWVDRFATDEGPQLIEEAGTDGVNAFVPTIRRLATLTDSATRQPSDPQIPPTFFTTRVQLALRQLAGQLLRAEELGEAVLDRLRLDDLAPAPKPPGPPRRPTTDRRNLTRRGGAR